MSEEINAMDVFKYGLIAVEQTTEDRKDGLLTILHFCGYMSPPTENDKKSLENELNTDSEFGLVGRINKDVFIVEAPDDMVKFYTGDAIKDSKVRIDKEDK